MEEIIEYLNNSKYRINVIKSLGTGAKFPSVISKDTDIPQNQVSAVLRQLIEKNIVRIINPEARKGRTYCLTNYGFQILNKL